MPNKYVARRVVCKLGHRHPSKAAAMHCWVLQCQIRDGTIMNLEYEKPYDLIVYGIKVGVHCPDFTYKVPIINSEQTGQRSFVHTRSKTEFLVHVDEVKGFRNSDWIFRMNLFRAIYPHIKYLEIR